MALKILKPEMAGDRDFMRRLARESKVCQELDHPNIAKLLGIDRQDGKTFLILDYLPGQDLNDRLQEGAFSLELGIHILGMLMEALAFAHRAGIVHRDVKPANIRLTPMGLKIMDFGMARVIGTSTDITDIGAVLGTPRYISPEQITGRPEDIDGRADQYSLGITAFEILTGSRPFADNRVPQLLTAHMTETPPPPSSLRPEIPEAIDRLILKMLAKSPSDRYPNLDEALAELSQIRFR